jgi:ankyrin repeat protein
MNDVRFGLIRDGPVRLAMALVCACAASAAPAQVPPSDAEIKAYRGLHAAAAAGDVAEIGRLIGAGADREARDANGRTPLHVAAFVRQYNAARTLMRRGADPNALDVQRYDIVTIAAVADDVLMLQVALRGGASARNVTSPYDGTALIAAAHLGHDEVVKTLIQAGAPLDHVNNLGWTALIESIVLGDGGPRHTESLRALVAAGANPNLADRQGATPLALAKARGYVEMVRILEQAGGR